MATEKNITMKQFNGTGYDTLYPKTIASQIPDVYSKTEVLTTETLSKYGLTADKLPNDVFQQIKTLIDNVQADVGGRAKIQTGSYIGTGTYGASNPCSLTFDFVPSVIMISGRGRYEEGQNTIVAVNKSPLSTIISGQYPFVVNVNFNGNQVSWYTTTNNPGDQANYRDSTYAYAAIG